MSEPNEGAYVVGLVLVAAGVLALVLVLLEVWSVGGPVGYAAMVGSPALGAYMVYKNQP